MKEQYLFFVSLIHKVNWGSKRTYFFHEKVIIVCPECTESSKNYCLTRFALNRTRSQFDYNDFPSFIHWIRDRATAFQRDLVESLTVNPKNKEKEKLSKIRVKKILFIWKHYFKRWVFDTVLWWRSFHCAVEYSWKLLAYISSLLSHFHMTLNAPRQRTIQEWKDPSWKG